MKHTLTTYIELELEISGSINAGCKGDRWTPGEPPFVEDFSVFIADGPNLTYVLSRKQTDELEDLLLENWLEERRDYEKYRGE